MWRKYKDNIEINIIICLYYNIFIIIIIYIYYIYYNIIFYIFIHIM